MIQQVDGLPVRLRTPHNLGFLGRWGRVFEVLDRQDSGNLCFGIEGVEGRVFVKYAGAETERHEGTVADAVAVSRKAAEVYRALAHPTLVRLRWSGDIGRGHALVFDWVDGIPLGRMYERRHELESLGAGARAAAVQQVLDFHVAVSERGWVAVDLYDSSVLVDPADGRVTLCDLDVYERAPLRNTMGRMWGSSRFMSPEEYELGAVIDHVSNVYPLGAMAHTFLGDDSTKNPDAWVGTTAQLAVASRALQARREDRWPSVAALAAAWRSTKA